MRLYDRLLAKGAVPTEMIDGFRAATVVVAENVSDYYFHGTDQEVWDVYEDFPNVAPPLDTMFIESRAPTHMVSVEDGISDYHDKLPAAWGVLMFARDILVHAPVDVRPAVLDGVRMGYVPRWSYEAVLFTEWGAFLGPLWGWLFCVAESGPVFRDADTGLFAFRQGPYGERLKADAADQDFLVGALHTLAKYLHTTLLTLSFMHCKNVGRHEVDPIAEWKAAHPKAKGYSPVLVRYHILDIDPMKEVLRTEGQSAESGIKRAIHICRGHFAHYTDERPLFGRVTGTFWKPQHVRGSKKQGIVLKDYRVHPSSKERE